MKLRLTSILLVVGLFSVQGTAQTSFFYSGGAHILSKGNAGTMFRGIESIYTNPAGLTSIEDIGADISYERRYNLSQLSTVSLAGGKRIGKSAIGVSISRFGFEAYNESKATLSYARLLWNKVSIGGAFNYLNFNVDQYGSANRFTFEFGLQSEINKRLSIGAHIFGPESVALTDDQDIPSRVSLGMRYSASQKADIIVDVSKTVNRNPEFKLAVEYEVLSYLSINAGANITQSSLHFGPSFNMKNGLSILGGYSFDNRLGHSSGISITWGLGRKIESPITR